MEYLKNIDPQKKKIVVAMVAIILVLILVASYALRSTEPVVIEEDLIDYDALEREAEIQRQINELDAIRAERGITYTEEDIQRQIEELDQIRESMNVGKPALSAEEQQALVEQQIRELDEIRNSRQ